MTAKSRPKKKTGQSKKALTPTQLADLRKFRHDLAILKKKGLYSGDARRAKPSSKLKNLAKEYRDVIDKKARVSKVKKKDVSALKEQNIKIRKNRAVTSKEYRVKNGKIFLAGKRQARTFILDWNDPEGSVYHAFSVLKPKYGLAMLVEGNSGYEIYTDPDDLLDALEFGTGSGVGLNIMTKHRPMVRLFNPKKSLEKFRDEAKAARELKLATLRHQERQKRQSGRPGRLAMLRDTFSHGSDLDGLDGL